MNEKEYEENVNVWKVFKIKNLGEYHDSYLETDVLLLVDVFEKFVENCLNYYRLDTCYYFSSPGLCWDTMLKMTKTKLQTVHDVNMYIFIEKGMRGGHSYISKSHSKIDEDNKFIMY